MDGLVVWQSKYGSTADYGRWIAAQLGFDAGAIDAVDVARIERARIVVVGGAVYGGKLPVAAWVGKNWPALAPRGPHLFVVSGMLGNDPAKLGKVMERAFPAGLRAALAPFSLPGRLDRMACDANDRAMLDMVVRMGLQDPALEALRRTGRFDFVNMALAAPVVAAVRQAQRRA